MTARAHFLEFQANGCAPQHLPADAIIESVWKKIRLASSETMLCQSSFITIVQDNFEIFAMSF